MDIIRNHLAFTKLSLHHRIAFGTSKDTKIAYNFIDPFKSNICNFSGTGGKESPCWLGLIRPMSLLTSYWSRQLLIIVSIFQMSHFPEVGTNGTPAPRRVHATTLISVAQSNINDSSFMFPGFYSAIQI